MLRINPSAALALLDREGERGGSEQAGGRSAGAAPRDAPASPDALHLRNYLPPALVKGYASTCRVTHLWPWQARALASTGVLLDRSRPPEAGASPPRPRNLVFCAPTSGGKTLVAEIIMLRRLFCEPHTPLPRPGARARAIFAVPFGALVDQKAAHLHALLNPGSARRSRGARYKVAAMHGIQEPLLGDACVVVATFERASGLLARVCRDYAAARGTAREAEVVYPSEFRVIVIDEIHMLAEVGRGAVAELLLARALSLIAPDKTGVRGAAGAAPDLQLVAMSATASNIAQLAAFASAELYSTVYRPVPLTQFLVAGPHVFRVAHKEVNDGTGAGGGGMEDAPIEAITYVRTLGGRPPPSRLDSNAHPPVLHSPGDVIKLSAFKPDALHHKQHWQLPATGDVAALEMELIGETLRERNNVLVFRSTKERCREGARRHMERAFLLLGMAPTDAVLSLRSAAIAEIRRPSGKGQYPSRDADLLCRVIEVGAAFHFADLSDGEKQAVERLFMSRAVNVLYCTSTLAAGVNLPCRRVLIDPSAGQAMLQAPVYRQMCGRAGRTGLDPGGESYLNALAAFGYTRGSAAIVESLQLATAPLPPVQSRLLGDAPIYTPPPPRPAGAGAGPAPAPAVDWASGRGSELAAFILDLITCATSRQGQVGGGEGIACGSIFTCCLQVTIGCYFAKQLKPAPIDALKATVLSVIGFLQASGLIHIPPPSSVTYGAHCVATPLGLAAADASLRPHDAVTKSRMLDAAQQRFLLLDSAHALFACTPTTYRYPELSARNTRYWPHLLAAARGVAGNTVLALVEAAWVDLDIVRHLDAIMRPPPGTNEHWDPERMGRSLPFSLQLYAKERRERGLPPPISPTFTADQFVAVHQLACYVALRPLVEGKSVEEAAAELNALCPDLRPLVLAESVEELRLLAIRSSRSVTLLAAALNWSIISKLLGTCRDALGRRVSRDIATLMELQGVKQPWRAWALLNEGLTTLQRIGQSEDAVAAVFVAHRPYVPLSGMAAAKAQARAALEEQANAALVVADARSRSRAPAMRSAPTAVIVRPVAGEKRRLDSGPALRALDAGAGRVEEDAAPVERPSRFAEAEAAPLDLAVSSSSAPALVSSGLGTRELLGMSMPLRQKRAAAPAAPAAPAAAPAPLYSTRPGMSPAVQSAMAATMRELLTSHFGGGAGTGTDEAKAQELQWLEMGEEEEDEEEEDEDEEFLVDFRPDDGAGEEGGPADAAAEGEAGANAARRKRGRFAVEEESRAFPALSAPPAVVPPPPPGSGGTLVPAPGPHRETPLVLKRKGEHHEERGERSSKRVAYAVEESTLDMHPPPGSGDISLASDGVRWDLSAPPVYTASQGLRAVPGSAVAPLGRAVVPLLPMRRSLPDPSRLGPSPAPSAILSPPLAAGGTPSTPAASPPPPTLEHLDMHLLQAIESGLRMIDGGHALHAADVPAEEEGEDEGEEEGEGFVPAHMPTHAPLLPEFVPTVWRPAPLSFASSALARVDGNTLYAHDMRLQDGAAAPRLNGSGRDVEMEGSFGRSGIFLHGGGVSGGVREGIFLLREEGASASPSYSVIHRADLRAALGGRAERLADSGVARAAEEGGAGGRLPSSAGPNEASPSSAAPSAIHPGGRTSWGGADTSLNRSSRRQSGLSILPSPGKVALFAPTALPSLLPSAGRDAPPAPAPLLTDRPFRTLLTMLLEQPAFALHLAWGRAPDWPHSNAPPVSFEGGTTWVRADGDGLWLAPVEEGRGMDAVAGAGFSGSARSEWGARPPVLLGLAVAWGTTQSFRFYIPLQVAPPLPTAALRETGRRLVETTVRGQHGGCGLGWAGLPLRSLSLIAHCLGFGRADCAVANERSRFADTLGYPNAGLSRATDEAFPLICRSWAAAHRYAWAATSARRWQGLAEVLSGAARRRPVGGPASPAACFPASAPVRRKPTCIMHNVMACLRALRERGVHCTGCELADPLVGHWMLDTDECMAIADGEGDAHAEDSDILFFVTGISGKALARRYCTDDLLRVARGEAEVLAHALASTEEARATHAGGQRLSTSSATLRTSGDSMVLRALGGAPPPSAGGASAPATPVGPAPLPRAIYLALPPRFDADAADPSRHGLTPGCVDEGALKAVVQYGRAQEGGGGRAPEAGALYRPLVLSTPFRVAAKKAVAVTWATMSVLSGLLRREQLDEAFRLVEMPVRAVLAEGEAAGCGVDETYLRAGMDLVEDRRGVLRSYLLQLVEGYADRSAQCRALLEAERVRAGGESFGSRELISGVLYDAMGLGRAMLVLGPLLKGLMTLSGKGGGGGAATAPPAVTLAVLEEWEREGGGKREPKPAQLQGGAGWVHSKVEQWGARPAGADVLRCVAAFASWADLPALLAARASPVATEQARVAGAVADLQRVGAFVSVLLEFRTLGLWVAKQAKPLLTHITSGGSAASGDPPLAKSGSTPPTAARAALQLRLLGSARVHSRVETLSATGRCFYVEPNLSTLQKDLRVWPVARFSVAQELGGTAGSDCAAGHIVIPLTAAGARLRKLNAINGVAHLPLADAVREFPEHARVFVTSASGSVDGRVRMVQGRLVGVETGGATVSRPSVVTWGGGGSDTPTHRAHVSKTGLPSLAYDQSAPLVAHWRACGFPYEEGGAADVPQVIVELSGEEGTEAAQGSLEATGGAIFAYPADQVWRVTARTFYAPPEHYTPSARLPWSRETELTLRTAIVAAPGHVLLTADYAQMELRLCAYLSQDAGLNAALSGEADVFKSIGAGWKHKPAEAITPLERSQTKRLVYGILYGMGAGKLAAELGVGKSEAISMQGAFWAAFPALRTWLRAVVAECSKRHYIQTVYGRRRYIKAAEGGADAEAHSNRQAVNSVVQGSAADLIKLAMQNIQAHVGEVERSVPAEGGGAAGPPAPRGLTEVLAASCRPWSAASFARVRLCLQIHDELLYEVRVSREEEAAVEAAVTAAHGAHVGWPLSESGPTAPSPRPENAAAQPSFLKAVAELVEREMVQVVAAPAAPAPGARPPPTWPLRLAVKVAVGRAWGRSVEWPLAHE